MKNTRKNNRKRMLALGLAGALTSCAGLENKVNEPALRTTVSSTFNDKYLLRIGLVGIDKPIVYTVLNAESPRYVPGLTVGLAETHTPSTNDASEVDLTVNYSRNLSDNLGLSLGAGYFSFVFGDEIKAKDVQELSASLFSRSLPVDLNFGVYQVFSPEAFEGREYIFGAGKTFDLGRGLSSFARGDVHFNDRYFSPKSDFSIATGFVGLNWNLKNGLSLNAGYKKSLAIDKDNFDNQSQWSFGGSWIF